MVPTVARAEFPVLMKPVIKSFTTGKKTFSIQTDWLISPETGEDILATQLAYKASFKARTVRWIQVARVQINDESDFIFTGFQEDRNLNRTNRGFFLDQNYDTCKFTPLKCSYFYRDHFTNPNESVEVENLSQIADFPFGWSLFKRISLESCAYNLQSKKYEGCILWGAEWPPEGNRFIYEPKFKLAPSADFVEALNRFKQYYNLKH